MRRACAEAHNIDLDWPSWQEYTYYMARVVGGVNMMGLVGHSIVRVQVMGTDFRRAATEQCTAADARSARPSPATSLPATPIGNSRLLSGGRGL